MCHLKNLKNYIRTLSLKTQEIMVYKIVIVYFLIDNILREKRRVMKKKSSF